MRAKERMTRERRRSGTVECVVSVGDGGGDGELRCLGDRFARGI